MAFEHTKDFRSAAQSSKRFQEHKAKWAFGTRPSGGVRQNFFYPDQLVGGSESQRQKVRPEQRDSHYHHRSHNIVKPRNGRIAHDVKSSHSRAKCEVLTELRDPSNLSRSIHEILPSSDEFWTMDNVLYSFDRAETPGKPLSLDVFVKTNPRETEKLVEKEYEILDTNGEALRGRKARRDLRRTSPQVNAQEPGTLEDEGFELI